MGSRAYRCASQLAASARGPARARAPVFFDLGEHFVTYADVLDDVREATALGTRDDVLSLYERYTKTGSPALLSRLSERGSASGRSPREAGPKGRNAGPAARSRSISVVSWLRR